MDLTKKAKNKWYSMMSRCYKKEGKGYKSYGAKGITVCKEWHKFDNFLKWYLEQKPDGSEHLDKDEICENLRIDPKIYSPATCQLVSVEDNLSFINHNHRKLKIKAIHTITGETKIFNSLDDASKRLPASRGQIGCGLNNKSRCKTVKGYELFKI